MTAKKTARILEDMGLVPTGEGVRDELVTVIKDAKDGVPSPGLGYGGDTGFESGEAFRDVLEHALGAATVGEPLMDAREYYLGLAGGEPGDPMDLDTHAAIAGLSPTEAARAVTGESVRRIVDPSAPYASARSPEVLETKFEDAFGSSVLDSERLPISFTAGMGHEAEREAYLSRGSDADHYSGMVDPTFAPDASIHYTDPLKHYDTEDVPGHLPLSLTTPFMTALEGMEHAAEFAPPEWEYTPVMPSPSDYSRPDMEPSAPVDDFSSMTIPSPSDLRGFEGPMTMPGDPRSPSLSYDYTGFGSPVISWYWPDGRVERISEEMAKDPTAWMRSPYFKGSLETRTPVKTFEEIEAEYAGPSMTYIDATGGPSTPFGGVGDIGGGSGTVTSPLTGIGGFYAPHTPHIGITAPAYVDPFPGMTDPTWASGLVWTLVGRRGVGAESC